MNHRLPDIERTLVSRAITMLTIARGHGSHIDPWPRAVIVYFALTDLERNHLLALAFETVGDERIDTGQSIHGGHPGELHLPGAVRLLHGRLTIVLVGACPHATASESLDISIRPGRSGLMV